jgi:hypothetical protein
VMVAADSKGWPEIVLLREIVLREIVLRARYGGRDTAGDILRARYCGRDTAGEILRVTYGGRDTAGEILRVTSGDRCAEQALKLNEAQPSPGRK